jgi:dolichol-phosphate mannosyltransferase
MKTTVIIPTYNESENIKVIIPLIFQTTPEIYITVVDDNSPDGTALIVKDLQKTFPRLNIIERKAKDGLGRAYIHAYREILKDKDVETVIMMDADLSHDPKHLREMIELRKKYKLVIGSRYVKGGSTTGWELYRRILSRYGNIYAKLVTGMPINDCTGGFNAISTDLLRSVDLDEINVSGYAFIIHLKYLLQYKDKSIFEIPICFKNRVAGKSKLSNLIIWEGILAPWKMVIYKK